MRNAGKRGAKAVLVPAWLAGSFYLVSLLLAAGATQPAAAAEIDAQWAPALLLVLPATLLGAIISALPLAAGVAVMTRLGRWNVGLRLPGAWAIAGAATIAAPVVVVSGGEVQAPSLALIFTGALCALVARRYVRWPDEYETAETCTTFTSSAAASPDPKPPGSSPRQGTA